MSIGPNWSITSSLVQKSRDFCTGRRRRPCKTRMNNDGSAGFDYEHPRLLGFPAFRLDRSVRLGIIESERLGGGRKLKHTSHRQRLLALKNLRNRTEV